MLPIKDKAVLMRDRTGTRERTSGKMGMDLRDMLDKTVGGSLYFIQF